MKAELKKIHCGNPLANLEMWDELEKYNAIQDAESLTDFYHEMLNKYEHRPFVCSAIEAMINFSTGVSFNPQILL